MRQRLEYGDETLEVTVPDHAVVVRPGEEPHEPVGLADPVAATRAALRDPVGCGPLRSLVRPGARVTIAFPDRVKGGTHATAHRKVAIPLVVEELEAGGVRREDITLVCAIGLHRKNTREEFADYLGRDTMRMFAEHQVVNHDAEDPDTIVGLDDSELGDPVEVSRHVTDADLAVMISHAAGNPYGGFSGGYKMPATGLTTWRSIRSHHSPGSLHRQDFLPISPRSHFRDQLASIGRRIESVLPQPLFTVDAVLNGRSEQVDVMAGRIAGVERATWPRARRRTDLVVPGPPAHVLVVGVPRTFHYGPGMGSNPILLLQAIGASLARATGALVERPVVIAAAVCDGWFNPVEFPSYERTYDLLRETGSASGMPRFEDDLSTDPEYVAAYRRGGAYHPFHAFSMVYMGGLVAQRARGLVVAGARSPEHARGIGGVPTATVEEALGVAGDLLGETDPRVLVVPSLSRPAYHLRTA